MDIRTKMGQRDQKIRKIQINSRKNAKKKKKKEVSTTIQWNLRDNLLYKAKKFRQTNHNPRYKIGLEERELIIRSRIKLVSLPNKYDFRKEGEDCLVPWGNTAVLQLGFHIMSFTTKEGTAELPYLIFWGFHFTGHLSRKSMAQNTH